MTVDLKGKNVLITGPTSGIGRGTALVLAEAGAKLILVARNPRKCERVTQEIVDAGGEAPISIIADSHCSPKSSGRPTSSSPPAFHCTSS